MTRRDGPEVVNGNTGVHVHRETKLATGQVVCMDCGRALIKPILSQEDFANRLAANGQPASLWLDAIKSLLPMPLDLILMELCDRLGEDRPGYIVQLMDRYEDDGNPPHTNNDSATNWWVTE